MSEGEVTIGIDLDEPGSTRKVFITLTPVASGLFKLDVYTHDPAAPLRNFHVDFNVDEESFGKICAFFSKVIDDQKKRNGNT